VEFIDITRPLSESTLTYPGDVPPVFRQEEYQHYRITHLHMSTHTGTHIDAPSHYLQKGDTIDTIHLSNIIGKCRVVDVTSAGPKIAASHLNGKLGGIDRLLLKTSFSGTGVFEVNFPSISEDAVRLINSYNMKCVGIDSLSIESCESDGTVHRELLRHGCIIIELLDLSKVEEKDYTMIALPLRLTGLDGSPARVVLLDNIGCE
jgi:arylformamidase